MRSEKNTWKAALEVHVEHGSIQEVQGGQLVQNFTAEPLGGVNLEPGFIVKNDRI